MLILYCQESGIPTIAEKAAGWHSNEALFRIKRASQNDPAPAMLAFLLTKPGSPPLAVPAAASTCHGNNAERSALGNKQSRQSTVCRRSNNYGCPQLGSALARRTGQAGRPDPPLLPKGSRRLNRGCHCRRPSVHSSSLASSSSRSMSWGTRGTKPV